MCTRRCIKCMLGRERERVGEPYTRRGVHALNAAMHNFLGSMRRLPYPALECLATSHVHWKGMSTVFRPGVAAVVSNNFKYTHTHIQTPPHTHI